MLPTIESNESAILATFLSWFISLICRRSWWKNRSPKTSTNMLCLWAGPKRLCDRPFSLASVETNEIVFPDDAELLNLLQLSFPRACGQTSQALLFSRWKCRWIHRQLQALEILKQNRSRARVNLGLYLFFILRQVDHRKRVLDLNAIGFKYHDFVAALFQNSFGQYKECMGPRCQ